MKGILTSKTFRNKIIASNGKNLDLTIHPTFLIMLAGHSDTAVQDRF